MIKKISWKEFQESGMLWWINRLLHTFGLVIIIKRDEVGKFIDVYPAKVAWRGFSRKDEVDGFMKVEKYLKKGNR